MENETKETRELTEAEMDALQKKQSDFYEKYLPFLRVQSEYETLTTVIVEQKLRRKIALEQMARMTFGGQESAPDKK